MLDNINTPDELTLKEVFQKINSLLRFFLSNKKIIIISIIVGSIIGLSYASFQKTRYDATLSFAFEEDKSGGASGLSGALGLASSLGIDLGSSGGAFSANNIVALMKSRLIIEKSLLKPIITENGQLISLADYYIRINELNRNWNLNPKLRNLKYDFNENREKYPREKDSILYILYNKITNEDDFIIEQKDKKVTILSLKILNTNENFAKTFCETLAREVSEFYISTKSKKARINVDILQKQTDSIRNELNSAIYNVASATDNVYNLNPALNSKGINSRKKQIDVQANTAILTQLTTQLELSKINLRRETPLIQVIDTPILPLVKIKISKLKSMLICGLIFGFLSSLILVLKKIYIKINP